MAESAVLWITAANSPLLTFYLIGYLVLTITLLYIDLFFSTGVPRGLFLASLAYICLTCFCLQMGLDGQLVTLSLLILDIVRLPGAANILSKYFTGREFFQKLRSSRCGGGSKNPVLQARECQLARTGRLYARLKRYNNEQKKMSDGIVSASDSDGTHLSSTKRAVPMDVCCIHIPVFALSRIVFLYFVGHAVMQFSQLFSTKLISVGVVALVVLGVVYILSPGQGKMARFLCYFRIF